MDKLGRIKLAIQYVISCGLAKNNTEVGKMLGYTSRSSFSQMTTGFSNIPRDFSSRFCKVFPSVSLEWLENEKGSIDGSVESSDDLKSQIPIVSQLKSIIDKQSEIIKKDNENIDRLIRIIERMQGTK